jgi:hypothetical protein
LIPKATSISRIDACWRASSRPGPVQAHGVDPLDLADADPVQPLHDQDSGRRQLGVDGRHPHPVVGGEPGGDLGRVAGLQPEVELLAEPLGELAGQLGDVVVGAPGGAGLGHLGQLGQHQQAAVDRRGHTGPLHLDDHRLAAAPPAPVRLGDRGGRDRLGVQLGERLGDGPAQPRTGPKPCSTAMPVIWA